MVIDLMLALCAADAGDVAKLAFHLRRYFGEVLDICYASERGSCLCQGELTPTSRLEHRLVAFGGLPRAVWVDSPGTCRRVEVRRCTNSDWDF